MCHLRATLKHQVCHPLRPARVSSQLLPVSKEGTLGGVWGPPPSPPQHLFGLLVGEDLWVVAVQLKDDSVHLLLTQAPLACQERRVLYQAVAVGLIWNTQGSAGCEPAQAWGDQSQQPWYRPRRPCACGRETISGKHLQDCVRLGLPPPDNPPGQKMQVSRR